MFALSGSAASEPPQAERESMGKAKRLVLVLDDRKDKPVVKKQKGKKTNHLQV